VAPLPALRLDLAAGWTGATDASAASNTTATADVDIGFDIGTGVGTVAGIVIAAVSVVVSTAAADFFLPFLAAADASTVGTAIASTKSQELVAAAEAVSALGDSDDSDVGGWDANRSSGW
jgi:hypothetical protein